MPDDNYITVSTDTLVNKTINGPTLETVADGTTRSLAHSSSALDKFPFDEYEAYKLRINAFANGAIFVLKQSDPVDTDKIKAIKALAEDRIQRIDAYINYIKQSESKKLRKGTLNVDLDSFIQELAQETKLTKKDITLGEAFWAWRIYKRPLVHETTYKTKDSLTITQREKLLTSDLTKKQKQELHSIHTENKPTWFTKLAPWAQTHLLKIVPEVLNGDWSIYQDKIIPATLRCIPGQANATEHTLIITDANNPPPSETKSIRQGVPAAFDMPDADRRASSSGNLSQMLDAAIPDVVQNFKTYWDLTNMPADTKCPVLIGGLLTPYDQAGFSAGTADTLGLTAKENNTQFVSDQASALATYQSTLINQHIQIFHLNVAVNKWRNDQPVPVDTDFLEAAKTIQRTIQVSVPEGNPKRMRLDNAIVALEAHAENEDLGKARIKNLYTAALYDVTTRLMGGCSTGNCKSSKDRKGMELVMADAMLIYYELYKEFPNYAETNTTNRANFVSIVADLYMSGHQLLIAHDNSPGSAGIKDEGFLDKDVIAELTRRDDSFAKSKLLANFNKPGTPFQKHETKVITGLALFSVIAIAGIILALATGGLAPAALLSAFVTAKIGALASVYVSIGAGVVYSTLAAGIVYAGLRLQSAYDSSQKVVSKQVEVEVVSQSSTADTINLLGGVDAIKPTHDDEIQNSASLADNIDTISHVLQPEIPTTDGVENPIHITGTPGQSSQ